MSEDQNDIEPDEEIEVGFEDKPKRIMLVTDAWEPQVNGVVRTLTRTTEECRAMGHEVEVIHPGLGYKTFPMPTYPEIRLAFGARKDIERRFKEFEPEAIHISTEGPLGMAARAVCRKWKLPFTTSYHTKYPEYVNTRFPFIPLSVVYGFMRRFHNSGGGLMVATPSMRDDLDARGFKNITPWARGVDTVLFNPDKRGIDGGVFKDLEGPIFVYVGRVSVEKNIEAFLDCELPGTKVVIGPGPQLDELRKEYPAIQFLGPQYGDELARYFADADVFVFPSLTDTFGLVILESMACGTPVAAFPAPGPIDLIPGTGAGAVSEDLQEACLEALKMKRERCREYAEGFSWKSCAEEFVKNLKPQPKPEGRRFWKRLRRLGRKERKPLF